VRSRQAARYATVGRVVTLPWVGSLRYRRSLVKSSGLRPNSGPVQARAADSAAARRRTDVADVRLELDAGSTGDARAPRTHERR